MLRLIKHSNEHEKTHNLLSKLWVHNYKDL